MIAIQKLFLTLLITSLPLLANADQSKSFGDYTVHYSTFTTDVLSADIAKQYKITRSKNRALVNISVLKKVMGTTGTPVKADLKGNAINLTQQLKDIEFRELVEDSAIYYLAVIDVNNEETLKFKLEVTPAGEAESFPVEFENTFYTK